MSIIRDISALDPRMRPLVERLLNRAADPVCVIETRRELTTQMAYYSRGRGPVALVKAFFARLGLWAITDAEAATTSTQTLYSKHIDGLAADIAPAKNGAPWWDAPAEVWERLWAIAEDECGLRAFGRHAETAWDKPHFEYREGV